MNSSLPSPCSTNLPVVALGIEYAPHPFEFEAQLLGRFLHGNGIVKEAVAHNLLKPFVNGL
jgi:hypothetical protein